MQTYDEKETAQILKVSVQTLRNNRSLGRGLPYTKLNRSVRYLQEDIENYILSNRIDPEGKAPWDTNTGREG